MHQGPNAKCEFSRNWLYQSDFIVQYSATNNDPLNNNQFLLEGNIFGVNHIWESMRIVFATILFSVGCELLNDLSVSVWHSVDNFQVADLKKELKGRGLSVVGNKTELVGRLQLSLQGGKLFYFGEDTLAELRNLYTSIRHH